jgi:hypothetical protein
MERGQDIGDRINAGDLIQAAGDVELYPIAR